MPLHDDSRLLSAESSPEGAVIRFVPPSVSLDDSNAPLLGALLTHFLDGGEEVHLIVELGNVENVSALALGVFNAMKCSSPIDCLAGHLLAAKLDLKGGSNPSILPVIAQADALLVAVNYGGPGINTANAAQNALALQLEVLIDAYTNQ